MKKYLPKNKPVYHCADCGEKDCREWERRMEYTACRTRYQSKIPNVGITRIQATQFMEIIIRVMSLAIANDHSIGMKEPGRVDPVSFAGGKIQEPSRIAPTANHFSQMPSNVW